MAEFAVCSGSRLLGAKAPVPVARPGASRPLHELVVVRLLRLGSVLEEAVLLRGEAAALRLMEFGERAFAAAWRSPRRAPSLACLFRGGRFFTLEMPAPS